MTELRKVRKVGGSLTLTIPPTVRDISEGDWVKFTSLDNGVLISVVKIDD